MLKYYLSEIHINELRVIYDSRYEQYLIYLVVYGQRSCFNDYRSILVEQYKIDLHQKSGM